MIESGTTVGVRNTFKDLDQAQANLEFLMVEPGGVMEQMQEIKPEDEATNEITKRERLQKDLKTKLTPTTGQADIFSQAFATMPDFQVGTEKNIFTAEYKDLTIQQRILVAGFDRLNERFEKADLIRLAGE